MKMDILVMENLFYEHTVKMVGSTPYLSVMGLMVV